MQRFQAKVRLTFIAVSCGVSAASVGRNAQRQSSKFQCFDTETFLVFKKYFVFSFVVTQFYRRLKKNVAILINKRQQRHVMTFQYIPQQAPQRLRSEASQNLPESHSSPVRCHPADGRVGTDGEKISLFKATLRLCLDPQLHCALSNLIKRLAFVRPACSSEFILLLKTVANLLLVQVCHTTGHSSALVGFFFLFFLCIWLFFSVCAKKTQI